MLLLLPAVAHAFASGRTTLERDVAPHNDATSSWRNDGSVPAGTSLKLHVPITIATEARQALEVTLYAVSDPDSPTYGKHLSNEEIKTVLAVPEERIERVASFFSGAGAESVAASPHGDALTVVMAASDVAKALHTTLALFSHKTKAVKIVRASAAYSVPNHIAADVTMVGELLQFPYIAERLGPAADVVEEAPADGWPTSCGSSCSASFLTPGVLQARYKVPVTGASPQAKNTMAVAEFQGQFFKESDLESFSTACSTPVDVASVIGQNKSSGGVEAELDIEYIKAVAPGVPLTVIYDAAYSLLNWGQALVAMAAPPLIASVSYGNDEAQQTGAAYMYSVNTVFMKAGTMGISILFASGDQGVCGREGCGILKKKFHPDFPGASPYVTAVGGTDFASKSMVGAEMAWSSGGGGFSDTFGIPSYQAAAVAGYFSAANASLPPQSMWNSTGRGYPDVAALGGQVNPYCVRTGGRWGGVAGTSAACPVVAGVFARLNGLRLGAGKPPMGFLNPFIYKNPGGFQDVTLGSNPAHGKHGFPAIAGWDAATGMGTPDYDALSKLI